MLSYDFILQLVYLVRAVHHVLHYSVKQNAHSLDSSGNCSNTAVVPVYK